MTMALKAFGVIWFLCAVAWLFAPAHAGERKTIRTERIENGHLITGERERGSTLTHETDRGPVDRVQPRERREIVRPRHD